MADDEPFGPDASDPQDATEAEPTETSNIIPKGADKPSASGSVAPINNGDKFVLLIVSVLLIWGVSWFSTNWGFYRDPPGGLMERGIEMPGLFLASQVLIMILAVIVLIFGETVASVLKIRTYNAGVPLVKSANIEVPQRLVGMLLWPLTIIEFGGLWILVQDTGGALTSPLAQLPILIIIISPYLMTEKWTPYLMLALGLGYYAALLIASDKAQKQAAAAELHPENWVFWLTTALSAGLSVYFVVTIRRAQQQVVESS